MRNSKEIKINVGTILTYKGIILGSGSIISMTERLDGYDTVVVNESVDKIDELIFTLWMQKNDSSRLNPSCQPRPLKSNDNLKKLTRLQKKSSAIQQL